MGIQYEQFISKENFILAYQRLKTVKRNEYKEFFYRDFEAFELFFEQNIEQLIHYIKEGIYKPQNCEKYYMPKKRNLARPISMLSIIDQIVYQALANVIADKFIPAMSRYFNINTFGNIFKTSTNEKAIFFYERWKTQWKKFNDKKVDYYNKKYRYLVEFDIASFYDTIDHNILCKILEKFGVELELINILFSCLTEWTVSSTTKINYKKSIGIPQGPVSSAFFAEVYLFELDEAIREYRMKYFRYADDISIMAKTHQDCQKAVVYLDLLARDLSLIPQSEKIGISHIEDINKHINNATAKFSKIAHEYSKKNYSLRSKTHTKLKKQLLDCFVTKELNKTIISFSLFKLNKDDEVKDALLLNIKDLELFYKGVIYYFNKYYAEDNEVINYISSFVRRIVNGEERDYIKHILASEFGANMPDNFLTLCKISEKLYKEIKDDIRMFISNRNIDASVALMALNLFHNVIYDVIAKNKNYSHGDYGARLEQLADDFPLACKVFRTINTTRNECTLAHYKDKNGDPRLKITISELNEIVNNVNLSEAYREIFDHYEDLPYAELSVTASRDFPFDIAE